MGKMEKRVTQEQARLTLPLGSVEEAEYLSSHIQAQLNRQQALGLKRVRRGLETSGARLNCGKIVATNADAVRYMLEQVTIQV